MYGMSASYRNFEVKDLFLLLRKQVFFIFLNEKGDRYYNLEVGQNVVGF